MVFSEPLHMSIWTHLPFHPHKAISQLLIYESHCLASLNDHLFTFYTWHFLFSNFFASSIMPLRMCHYYMAWLLCVELITRPARVTFKLVSGHLHALFVFCLCELWFAVCQKWSTRKKEKAFSFASHSWAFCFCSFATKGSGRDEYGNGQA